MVAIDVLHEKNGKEVETFFIRISFANTNVTAIKMIVKCYMNENFI